MSKSTWIIAVQLGQKIAAKFTRMKLEKAANENQCDDYVEIKDGLLGMDGFSSAIISVTEKFNGARANREIEAPYEQKISRY